MKNSGNLLLEVERMREIMGFNTLPYQNKKYIKESVYKRNGLLLEAYTPKEDGIRYVFKALGFEDEVAESMAKQAAEQWDGFARNLGDVLEREGLDDIGKIQNSLRQVAPDAARLSDPEFVENALKLYFKNNPDVATTILKETPSFYNSVIKAMDLDTLISDAPTRDGLNLVLNAADDELSVIRQDIEDLINVLEGNATFRSNPEGQKIITGLKTKLGIADNITSKVPDPPADTPVMQKEFTQQGRTQAEIDAEKAQKEAEEKAKRDAEERDIQKKKSEEELANRKNEKIEDAEESLKNDPNWSKAWSLWDKVIRYFGMGKASKYLSQARKTFSEMTLGELQNVTSSSQYRQLVRQLEDRIRAKSKNKQDYSQKIDGLGRILDSLKKLVLKFPIIGTVAKALGAIVSGMAVIWILWCLYENVEWINKLTNRIYYITWDGIDNIVGSEFETSFPDCLSDIKGYWSLTLDQQTMLASTGLACANATDKTNYATYATNVEFAAGSSVMDPKTKEQIVKPDRFIVTIGGNPVEFPVDGGKTPPTPGTGKYPNTEEGFALWVSEKKTGSVFGVDYVWSDNKGFAGQGTKNADNTYPNYKPLTWKDANTGWE